MTPNVIRSNAKKHPAQLTEVELSHLEVVLGIAYQQFAITAVPALDLTYWTARVAGIARQYDLVASQTKRVAALSRLLVSLQSSVETLAERRTQPSRIAA